MSMDRWERAIRQASQENFDAYWQDWVRDHADLDELAEEYWQERTELEVNRDIDAGVTIGDYKRVVRQTFDEWYRNWIASEAGIIDDTDGNGLSVDDILSKGSKIKILKYLGHY
jgi:hypothetical protein